MPFVRVAVAFFILIAAALPAGRGHARSHDAVQGGEATADGLDLARFVERRASRTSFAELDAFGRAAVARDDREGLNRLYHVTWTILNQGDFERAATWNGRLAERATRLHDARYVDIARLNQLTIRYDRGEVGVAREMERYAATGRDWFVRAHAARLTALSMMDQGRVGEGLRLLTQAQADIPEGDAFAKTALAGIWEVVGMGLKELNDIEGATVAFRKFEIDYSNPLYPRPDFDSLYNLAKMAVRVGDEEHAGLYFASHHRAARVTDLPVIKVYDAALCAMVHDARNMARGVLACLNPYGEDLGEASTLALDVLPIRAMARARTGDVAGARRDLAKLKALSEETGVAPGVARVEAEILFAEGRAADGYRLLREHLRESEVGAARSFSAGIHQVTGDMQQQLAERRRQLDTVRANAGLQTAVILIAIVFLLSAGAVVLWQMRQAERLRQAQRRAEAANRAKSEFLANMSHEIRTPLNGVVSMADALSRRSLDVREHEMVELIRSSGATLERLLSDILDSAKIEAGQVALEPVAFDLRQAVGDVALLWRAKAEDKGVALVFDMDADVAPWVEGDAVRLRQILTNLVSNALKFTTEGQVRLAVSAGAEGRIAFRVCDTGVGFDEAQKARIFQRFQQADGSITRRFGGTGLGLAISSALVELMGGELDCDSAPGRGSTFFFEIALPAAAAPETTSPEPVKTLDLAQVPLRVLLADDHPANRKVVEIMLSATAMELVAVEDGRQALEAFKTGGFDLVLMDMQMPVMDGLTATAAIRAHEAEHGLDRTAVLMLTANAMAEHVERGREAGADGHLAKPITLSALFAAIGEALGEDEVREAA